MLLCVCLTLFQEGPLRPVLECIDLVSSEDEEPNSSSYIHVSYVKTYFGTSWLNELINLLYSIYSLPILHMYVTLHKKLVRCIFNK